MAKKKKSEKEITKSIDVEALEIEAPKKEKSSKKVTLKTSINVNSIGKNGDSVMKLYRAGTEITSGVEVSAEIFKKLEKIHG